MLENEENEQLECVVCFCEYSRGRRIPRLLHCKHTFCAPCLQRLSRTEGVIRTISCPLCRWITCTSSSLTLPSVLWVNTEIWDRIVERQQQQEKQQQEKQQQEKQQKRRQGSVEEDMDFIPPTLSDSRQLKFVSILQNMFLCVPKHHAELDGC